MRGRGSGAPATAVATSAAIAPSHAVARVSIAAASRVPAWTAAAVLALGTAAAWHYAALDLALTHWDARAHLVVARRILDSLTPGWQQIGGVWLPLPHLLNMLPVQVDAWYRSGASGTALSVASMAVAAFSLASLILRTTTSRIAAATGGVLLIANPNVLYLQSTPMTEPLLFGTTLLAVDRTARWVEHGGSGRGAGLALAAACMTRYEAWPIAAALLALGALARFRVGERPADLLRGACGIAVFPAVVVALFLANSRWTTGAWFIPDGFFVPENDALGRPDLAWLQVREGLDALSGGVTKWGAAAGGLAIAVAFVLSRERAPLALLLAPLAAAALPFYAYLEGHPERVRYSVPLVVACTALAAGGAALLPRRLREAAAAALVVLTLWQSSPLDRTAPLIAEAGRDAGNMTARAPVTWYLEAHYDGRLIMASMGSLAHYMHDLSKSGFALRDFLHEGNGEVWAFALLLGPRDHVGWVLIEEQSEGGDTLALRARDRPDFLRGFERVAEGGGVALYKAVAGNQ